MADKSIGSSQAASMFEVFDLTNDAPQTKDHMSTVAEMIRQESRQSLKELHGKNKQKTRIVAQDQTEASLHQPKTPSAPDSQASLDEKRAPPFQSPDNYIDISDSEEANIFGITSTCPKRSPKPIFHKFLELPPEIRNNIYRLLLTTPGIPIELPRLTGPEGRRREAAWAESVVLPVYPTFSCFFL